MFVATNKLDGTSENLTMLNEVRPLIRVMQDIFMIKDKLFSFQVSYFGQC